MEKALDKYTGEEFVKKRINQVFAKAQNRIAYYNKKANNLRHSVSYINKPLHTNLRILNELLENKQEATFHKQFLEGKGFSFSVHTHLELYEEKNQFAIYKYIILNPTHNYIKIIKQEQ